MEQETFFKLPTEQNCIPLYLPTDNAKIKIPDKVLAHNPDQMLKRDEHRATKH